MIITPFDTNLFQQLTPYFMGYTYALLPEKKQFRRETAFGFQNIVLSSVCYPTDTVLEVNFGVRNNQIEQIAQQFLNNLPDFRPDVNTFLLSIGRFNGLPYARYKIHSENELASICRQIKSFFETHGFNFLAHNYTLSALDKLLNEQPNLPCRYVYNQTHRCYKGLIAARLNHNPNYDLLLAVYRQALVQLTQNPHEQLNFERLITFLAHYSAN